nr:hypothetical protein [Tanacetum cinerariifolium]
MSRQYSCVRQQATPSMKDNNEFMSWKSKDQQELYRSKLVQALRQIQVGSSHLSGHVVREAANRAHATTGMFMCLIQAYGNDLDYVCAIE